MTAEWRADPGFGVYVHIPFCRHRCHYCDFNTYEGLDDAARALRRRARRATIERWTGAVARRRRSSSAEERRRCCRPRNSAGSWTPISGRCRHRAGCRGHRRGEPRDGRRSDAFARPSRGGLQPRLDRRPVAGARVLARPRSDPLRRTRRWTRSPPRARPAFDDVNADLIYGSPWETDGRLGDVAARAHRRRARSRLGLRADDRGGDPARHARRARAAFPTSIPTSRPTATRRPTRSSARPATTATRSRTGRTPGRASTHNVLYWSAGDYLGFGAGAHGHLDGRR